MAKIIKSDDGKILIKVVEIENEHEIIADDFDLISQYSFAGLNNLKSIRFDGIIKRVEAKAFVDCENLEEITFSNSDVEEDRSFYYNCNSYFRYSKANQPIFKPITVSELFNKSFFINDYQRGYRWGKDEVLALLDDINNCKTANSSKDYYLQPLVLCSEKNCNFTKTLSEVWETSDNTIERTSSAYEVIDGQQRLTTMYILLSSLDVLNPFNVYYKYVRKTDGDFIKQAKEILGKEIKKRKVDKQSLSMYIKKHVKYIWYEITDPNANPKTLFRDFNSGKTPLTNSELFRAFLFNRNNFIEDAATIEDKEDRNKELNLISMEWDAIEQNLKDDSFWFFIANSSFSEKNRMDYILDLYASQQDNYNVGLDEKKERYSFNVFVSHFDDLKKIYGPYESMKKIWSEYIKDIYDRLYSWYLDTELSNYIGYLIATELTGKDFEDSFVPNYAKKILKLSKTHNKNEFETQVKKEIKNLFSGVSITDLKYKNKDTVKNVLLLVNVWEMTMNKNLNLRFPFELYKNSFMDKEKKQKIIWNIEHINAHQLSVELVKNCQSAIKKLAESEGKIIDENSLEYKTELKQRLDEQVNYLIEELQNQSSIYSSITYDQNDLNELVDFVRQPVDTASITNVKRGWTNICKTINDAFSDEDAPVNSISNLTLLDEKTNKGYGNSFFKEKRVKIIERDKTSAYIPICTKNIFLKYYGTTASEMNWGTGDMSWFMTNVICKCIDYFRGIR